MTALRYMLGFPWVQPLIHFLWQGATIGLCAAIILPMAGRASSQVRYLLACGFLALCVLVPALTFVLLARPPIIFRAQPEVIGNAIIEETSSPSPAVIASVKGPL